MYAKREDLVSIIIVFVISILSFLNKETTLMSSAFIIQNIRDIMLLETSARTLSTILIWHPALITISLLCIMNKIIFSNIDILIIPLFIAQIIIYIRAVIDYVRS